MRSHAWCFVILALGSTALTGCVERRFVVTSQPMGALVYHDGKPVGTTPCDVPFVYYGVHAFTFVKDGYETKTERYEIIPPWYQYPWVDAVTEILVPFTFQDVQEIRTTLNEAPKQVPNLVPRSLELRERVRAIPTPDSPPLPQPTPVIVPPPVQFPQGM